MTLSFICVFVAFLLCLAPKLLVSLTLMRLTAEDAPTKDGTGSTKGGQARQSESSRKRIEAWRARSLAAQRDALETFAPFAAGVIIAHLAGLDDYRAGLLAATFVVARALHLAARLARLDYLRHAIWGVGFLSTAMLYVLPWLM